MEKVPVPLKTIEGLDSFLQIGAPLLYITDIVILSAVTYLFIRRVFIPQVRYISLPADYFPLFLILGIALSGVLMRYFFKVNVTGIKELAIGLIGFGYDPKVLEGAGVIFYIHLFLVSSLLAYFPFSKLMHMGGIFLSPTRNMVNDSRMKRHVNPWNYPVKVHSYEEYEEEFREKMKGAGIPVEKE
jgi:nitrate reductase gamma subunit